MFAESPLRQHFIFRCSQLPMEVGHFIAVVSERETSAGEPYLSFQWTGKNFLHISQPASGSRRRIPADSSHFPKSVTLVLRRPRTDAGNVGVSISSDLWG